jgi:DNA-binding transcriptional LysR family regulator
VILQNLSCVFAGLTIVLDWDDLRIFLTTGRSGSFSGAGLRLGMDATTVARRIRRLETSLRCTLFVRSPHGLQLTAAGAKLLGSSEEVEHAIEAAQSADASGGMLGTVRISASEAFGALVLAPELPELLRRRAGLAVELVANSGFLSPSTREVDIAVTLNPVASERLSIKRLTDYDLGLYASPDYLAQAGTPERVDDLPAHQLVGYIDDLIYAPQLRYLDEVIPGLRPRITSSSIRAQAALIAGGAGLGVLPVFLAADHPKLERVMPAQVRLSRTFWIVAHQDLKSAPRVRIVEAWLNAVVERRRGLLSGG